MISPRGTFLGFDGRPVGHWVYMLLCQDDGPVYVKVGISGDPTARFAAIANTCAVTPRVHCFVHVRDRRVARRIELQMLEACKEWRTTGEWLRVPEADRDRFNAALSPILRQNSEFGWRLRWQKIDAKRLLAVLKARRDYFRHRWSRAGAAGRDAMRDLARERTRR